MTPQEFEGAPLSQQMQKLIYFIKTHITSGGKLSADILQCMYVFFEVATDQAKIMKRELDELQWLKVESNPPADLIEKSKNVVAIDAFSKGGKRRKAARDDS